MLDLPGAVEADPPDSGVAAHYGHLAAEQRALQAGTAFVDLSHRDVIEISGPDRFALLHALTTQHFEKVRPGQLVSAFVLSPQGRIEHAFSGVDDGTAFHAHTEPGTGAALVTFLEQMKFTMRVDTRLDRTLVVLGHWTQPRENGSGGPQARFIAADQLDTASEQWGAAAGIWAYEALRIEAGVPRIGFDTDELTIPNELSNPGPEQLLGLSVHLDKGCYRGQETVARVHNLGRPPRRLTRLLLDGSVNHLPARGAQIVLDGRTVGRLGTVAMHHELGPIALGLLKRNTDPTAELVVDDGERDVAASQELIVDPDVGLHVRPTQTGIS